MMDPIFTSAITVRLINQCGGDSSVVAAAKVSTSGEEALRFADTPAGDNYGLINYLMKCRHASPFEHGLLTFFVHAPIFVFREWHRHRTMSFNEESARYKELEPIYWIPRRDRKMVPVEGFKSARPEFTVAAEKQYEDAVRSLQVSCTFAHDAYQSLLKRGIAREVARTVLPVGIYSSCWVSANPRALMHFLSLRTRDEKAAYPSYPQAEISEAANQCEDMFRMGWPLTWRAFHENGRVAP